MNKKQIKTYNAKINIRIWALTLFKWNYVYVKKSSVNSNEVFCPGQ